MYNPYAESLSSTGEPPTVSPDDLRDNISSTDAGTISQQETSQISLSSSSSSRSLLVQEPDSGYEASPSSIIADNQRFFGEQSMAVANASEMLQSHHTNSDDIDDFDIVECHSQILFSESESDELDDYDTCLDCSSSLVSCNCYRTDSSNTNATATNCDNSRCNSSELSYNRPSSQPIQIPMLPSCRIRSNGHPRIEIFGPLIDMGPHSRSQPIDLCPLQRFRLIPETHPLSWPSTALRNRRNIALPSPRNNNYLTNRDIPNFNNSRRYNHPVRTRRQIIDSDASSFCSSDDDGPEDVFNLPSGEASSYPTMMVGSGPLPDVVLESTDSSRRSRSMSINLPPNRERVIHGIGQSLRRMSDLFEQRNQMRMGRVRSRTTSDCNELHRNGLS